jgi:hypothetical protein
MGEGEEEWQQGKGRVRERENIEENIEKRRSGTVRERENYKNPKQKKVEEKHG